MKYSDELWIERMNAYKKGVEGTLDSGIRIRENMYLFHREIFYDMFSVMIPDSFLDLPIEAAKLKYPSEQRPKVIKSNQGGDINFGFSILLRELKTQDVIHFRDALYQSLRTVQPANLYLERGETEADGTLVGWFDFKSFALDDSLYTLMFCRPIKGKLLHGIFNCRLKQAEYWKSVALQLVASFQEERQVENT